MMKKLNESAEDNYIEETFEKGDMVQFDTDGGERIKGIVVETENGIQLVIKDEDGKVYHENANDVELYDEALNENIEGSVVEKIIDKSIEEIQDILGKPVAENDINSRDTEASGDKNLYDVDDDIEGGFYIKITPEGDKSKAEGYQWEIDCLLKA